MMTDMKRYQRDDVMPPGCLDIIDKDDGGTVRADKDDGDSVDEDHNEEDHS